MNAIYTLTSLCSGTMSTCLFLNRHFREKCVHECTEGTNFCKFHKNSIQAQSYPAIKNSSDKMIKNVLVLKELTQKRYWVFERLIQQPLGFDLADAYKSKCDGYSIIDAFDSLPDGIETCMRNGVYMYSVINDYSCVLYDTHTDTPVIADNLISD